MISHPLLKKYDWTITNDGIGPLKIGQTRSSIHLILHPFFQEKYKQYADYLPFPTDVVEELGIRIAYNKEGHCYYISIEQPMASSLVIPEHLDRYAAVKCRRSFDQKILSVRVAETALLRDYGLERLLRCFILTNAVSAGTCNGEHLLRLDFGEGFLQAVHRLGKRTDVFDIKCDEVKGDYALCSKDNKVILYFRSPGIFSSAEFVPPECPSVGGDHFFAGSYQELATWIKSIDQGAVEEEDRIISYKKGLTVLLASSGDRAAPPHSVMYSSEYELGRFRNFSSISFGSSLVGYAVRLMRETDIDELVQERFALLTDNEDDFSYIGATEVEASRGLDDLGKQGDTFRHLLCQTPERLQGYQEEFLKRKIFHYPLVFLNAPKNIRDALLDLLPRLDQEDIREVLEKIPLDRTWRILESLAWIGDEKVRKFFLSLPDLPRPYWFPEEESWWFTTIDTMVDFKHIPHRAGWELLPDGGRRELVLWQRFGLTPPLTEKQQKTETTRFLAVQEEISELSGAPLIVYFDIDLTDARFSFLEVTGRSLRLVADPLCVRQGYFELTREGGCKFIPAEDFSVKQYSEGCMVFPELPLIASPLPTSPYNTSDGSGLSFQSYLGGLPRSQGFLRYPRCPHCSARMIFLMYLYEVVGAVGYTLDSLLFFLCRDCLTVRVILNNPHDTWQHL